MEEDAVTDADDTTGEGEAAGGEASELVEAETDLLDPTGAEVSAEADAATVAGGGEAAGVRGHSRTPVPTISAATTAAAINFQPGAPCAFAAFEWRPPITTPPTSRESLRAEPCGTVKNCADRLQNRYRSGATNSDIRPGGILVCQKSRCVTDLTRIWVGPTSSERRSPLARSGTPTPRSPCRAAAGGSWREHRRSTPPQLRNYLTILVTDPAPTVRPPSRIAKRRPSSMAMG